MEAHSGLFSLCRDWETKDFPAAHKAIIQRHSGPVPARTASGTRRAKPWGEQNEHKQGGIFPLSL